MKKRKLPRGQESDSEGEEEENDVPIPNKTNTQPKHRNGSQKKSVRDRLAEITALKEKIAREKLLLEQSQENMKQKHPMSSNKVQSTRGGDHKTSQPSPSIREASTASPSQIPVFEEYGEEEEASDNEGGEEIEPDHILEEEIDSVGNSSRGSHVQPSDFPTELKSAELKISKPISSSEKTTTMKPNLRQKDPKLKKVRQAVLESAAVKIQANLRRWRTMRYARAFKQQAITSSILLQRIVRGFCARIRVKKALLRKRAAVLIQKRARGMNARVSPSWSLS